MTRAVQDLYSKDGRYRVSILERADDLLEVRAFAWRHEVVPGYGEACDPYWSEIPTVKTLADTPERAQEIALEELRGLAGSSEWTSHWNNPDENQS